MPQNDSRHHLQGKDLGFQVTGAFLDAEKAAVPQCVHERAAGPPLAESRLS